MKKIIILSGLMFLGGICNAASSDNFAVMSSSVQIRTVSISSFTATEITPTASAMGDRAYLVLQDLDSSNSIFCSEQVITSTSTNVFMVPKAGTPYSLPLRWFSQGERKTMKIYCITEKTTGTSVLSVVQGY